MHPSWTFCTFRAVDGWMNDEGHKGTQSVSRSLWSLILLISLGLNALRMSKFVVACVYVNLSTLMLVIHQKVIVEVVQSIRRGPWYEQIKSIGDDDTVMMGQCYGGIMFKWLNLFITIEGGCGWRILLNRLIEFLGLVGQGRKELKWICR